MSANSDSEDQSTLTSLPDRPLTVDEISDLHNSDEFLMVRPIMVFGGNRLGFDTEKDLTKDVVFATEDSVYVAAFHGDDWVIEDEEDLSESETPEDDAMDLYQEYALKMTDATKELLGQSD